MKHFSFLLVLFFFNITAPAQYCASNPMQCPITYNLTTAGFQNYSTFPCVVNNQSYSHTFELYVPNFITYNGIVVQIDSIGIAGIDNLPCGLCWNSSKSSNTFAGNTHNCIAISGLPNDSEGSYKLSLTGIAYTNFGPLWGQLDYPGFQIFLRVINSGANCNAADTTNSIQACQSGSCKVQGVEFIEVSSKNTCYSTGNYIQVGLNKSFAKYKWIVRDPINGSRSYYSTSTVDIPYNAYETGFSFFGIDSNGCTFSSDTISYPLNFVNALGLIQAPKICSINLDTSIANGQYSITLQTSNFSNHLLTSTDITTQWQFNNLSVTLTTNNVLQGFPSPVLQAPMIDTFALGFDYKSSQCGFPYKKLYGNASGTELYSDGSGYPVLSIVLPLFSGIYNVDSFEVYRRGNGSNWQFFRKYFNTTPILIGDNAPFSTNMEYMVVCYPSSDCNPNRSNNSNIVFKRSIQVPAAIVVNAIDESQLEQIDVFPNPTTNTIAFKGDIHNLSIWITNSIGQKLEVATNNNKIDISAFERGVYFVVISNKESKKTFRVVKL